MPVELAHGDRAEHGDDVVSGELSVVFERGGAQFAGVDLGLAGVELLPHCHSEGVVRQRCLAGVGEREKAGAGLLSLLQVGMRLGQVVRFAGFRVGARADTDAERAPSVLDAAADGRLLRVLFGHA